MSLEMLKNAAKAVGAKQAAKAVEKELAETVYLASDADERVTLPIRELCMAKKVPVEDFATMQELGQACGIAVGAAAVAIVRKNESR